MSNTFEQMKQHNPDTLKYLDKGFVTLLETMGSDHDIEYAARMSYGAGTRTINDTRTLLRYLMRHWHTSPFEMGVVRFHVKVPIFIARQLMRHRTFSFNELSGRYSLLETGSYLIDKKRCNPQSETNKQCSDTAQQLKNPDWVQSVIDTNDKSSKLAYDDLIDAGLARELARGVLPLNTYTEIVFNADLKNFMHFLKLRIDPNHAQAEIVELANLMYDLLKKTNKFDLTLDAFENYHYHGDNFSFYEMQILKRLLINPEVKEKVISMLPDYDGFLSKREIQEFKDKLQICN